MDDSVRVKVIQTRRQPVHDFDHFADAQVAIPDVLTQVVAVHILHQQATAKVAVAVLRLDDLLVIADDTLVVQTRRDKDLPAQVVAPPPFPFQVVTSIQHLDRDREIPLPVDRLVDLTHAPRANGFDDLVVIDVRQLELVIVLIEEPFFLEGIRFSATFEIGVFLSL